MSRTGGWIDVMEDLASCCFFIWASLGAAANWYRLSRRDNMGNQRLVVCTAGHSSRQHASIQDVFL